jgi:hypothetical protein
MSDFQKPQRRSVKSAEIKAISQKQKNILKYVKNIEVNTCLTMGNPGESYGLIF